MKALTLYQPWASLCVTRPPCSEFCDNFDHLAPVKPHPMVKQFETRTWPCPPDLIGQRIAIHAAKREPRFEHVGSYTVCRQNLSGAYGITPTKDRWDLDDWVRLPLGAVVGSAVVADCLPIVERGSEALCMPCVDTDGHTLRLVRGPNPDHDVDISDQLPYGDFSPGRFAWMLTDAEPCDPLPWRGRHWNLPDDIAQRVWQP